MLGLYKKWKAKKEQEIVDKIRKEMMNSSPRFKVSTPEIVPVKAQIFSFDEAEGKQYVNGNPYMREVMNIPSSQVYIMFSIICVTAPTLGVLSGGFFIQYLGGYTNKMALDACFKISIIAAGCGIFLPFFDITAVFVIFMWLLLFFGGSITPGLTGVMIAAIPENSKEIGNSLSQLFYNLIG